jgi:hypothetical protein
MGAHLADTRVTDEEELEEVVVLGGVHDCRCGGLVGMKVLWGTVKGRVGWWRKQRVTASTTQGTAACTWPAALGFWGRGACKKIQRPTTRIFCLSKITRL